MPTGNPRGRPRKTYDQKKSRKSRLNDIRETCNVLQNVPLDQAKEAFLKFLRDNQMASEEQVIKKVSYLDLRMNFVCMANSLMSSAF